MIKLTDGSEVELHKLLKKKIEFSTLIGDTDEPETCKFAHIAGKVLEVDTFGYIYVGNVTNIDSEDLDSYDLQCIKNGKWYMTESIMSISLVQE